MNKHEIVASLVISLKEQLDTLVTSALEAKDAATNEESKAENKYDTRGLEASYLAGAQAERAVQLKKDIDLLESLPLIESEVFKINSLIELHGDDESKKLFILLPCRGGEKIFVGDIEVTVVTPEAPIAAQLLNLAVDDEVELTSGGQNVVFEVVTVC